MPDKCGCDTMMMSALVTAKYQHDNPITHGLNTKGLSFYKYKAILANCVINHHEKAQVRHRYNGCWCHDEKPDMPMDV